MPKKRGPKTDVLDALLKRVDGLEAKLREKNSAEQVSPTSREAGVDPSLTATDTGTSDSGEPAPKRVAAETRISPNSGGVPEISPIASGPKYAAALPTFMIVSCTNDCNTGILHHRLSLPILCLTLISPASTRNPTTSWTSHLFDNVCSLGSCPTSSSTPSPLLHQGMRARHG